MSEKGTKYEVKVKREPVTVRLNQEVIVLGRSLARSIYGNEDKLGNLIEDAINFMSAHQENEARTNALLQTTEQTLFNRFDNQIESMYKALINRDNKLVERIAGLMAVSSFETTLTELMLKDLYCRDDKTKARYEEIRSLASKKMKDRYEKANLTEVLELQEKIMALEKDIESLKIYESELEITITNLKAKNTDLSQKKSEISKHLTETIEKLKMVIEAFKAYKELVDWYEKRDKEVPAIQDKNKKLLSRQPYEEALKEFESSNYKPHRPKINL